METAGPQSLHPFPSANIWDPRPENDMGREIK